MKNRRWFLALSVLLLAALLCTLGPAACAEGPDSEAAFRTDLSLLSAHSDEIKTMREDALADYLNCLFAAEETDDPSAQELLLKEADLCWMLYTDLLSVQSKAELAAWTTPEEDPFLDRKEQRPEGRNEFCLDGSWPFDAHFRPEENYVPGGEDDSCGFAGCPYTGFGSSWQQDWTPGWGYWDDGFDDHGFDDHGDFLPSSSDDGFGWHGHGHGHAHSHEHGHAEAYAQEETPAGLTDAAETLDNIKPMKPDIAAMPAETPEETDEYADWEEFEDLFMQALLEALFGDQTQEMVTLPNPWIETASPDEAAAAAGLKMDAPEALPKGMELQQYRAMEGTVEADYSDGYDELTLRASLTEEGLALTGDYNDYSVAWQEEIDGLVVDCLGDGEKINAAAWSVDGIAYALDMAPGKEGLGLSRDEMSAIMATLTAVPVKTEIKAEPDTEAAAPSGETLELPFTLEEEAMTSEAVDSEAEAFPASSTGGRQVRLIVGGGETYVIYD